MSGKEGGSVDSLQASNLPMADVQETDRLETAAIALFKANVFTAAEVIVETATGIGVARLQYDAASQIINRVLGPVKGPSNDWVDDLLKDVRNTPEPGKLPDLETGR